MSRFGETRWQRLAVWSGAALAWGSTLVAVLESSRAESQSGSTNAPAESTASENPALPTQPAGGLLVIRYQADPEPSPAAATVTVTQPAAVAQPAPPPQPTSSGS